MTTEQLLIETWRQLPAHRQQEVIDFVQFLAEHRRHETSPSESPLPTLGEKLQTIRNRLVDSGTPLLTEDQVEQEVLARRGGYQECP